MTLNLGKPPTTNDLLRELRALPHAWRGRYAVLKKRNGIDRAVRQTLREYHEAEDARATDLDVTDGYLLVCGAV